MNHTYKLTLAAVVGVCCWLQVMATYSEDVAQREPECFIDAKTTAAPGSRADTRPNLISKQVLDQMLADYKEYGLPLPPANAEFCVQQRYVGKLNDKPWYKAAFGFREMIDGKAVLWMGYEKVDGQHDTVEVIKSPTAKMIDGYRSSGRATDFHEGFEPYSERTVGIFCISRGWYDVASRLLQWPHRPMPPPAGFIDFGLEPPPPRDPRSAVATIAWNYWCNQFATTKGDRRPIIERLKHLRETRPEFNTRSQQTMIRDMEATCADRKPAANELEALVDSLVDLGGEEGRQSSGIESFSGQKNHDGYLKLQEAGLPAVPVLINHLQDFRLTRCVNSTERETWHVRIAEVVAELLRGFLREEFAFDSDVDGGRRKQVDLAHVLYWWSGVQKQEALAYINSHLIAAPAAGVRHSQATVAALHVLGQRYPQELIGKFPQLLLRVGNSRPLFEALANSQASNESKTQILLDSTKNQSILVRLDAIRCLFRMKHLNAVTMLTREMDSVSAMPQTSNLPLGTGQRFAEVVVSSADENVWATLQKMSGKVDARQRMEMLETVGDNFQNRDLAMAFIGSFLSDTDLYVAPDTGRRPEAPFARDRIPFHDPLELETGFVWKKLAVRDFATLQLAPELGVIGEPLVTWNDEEWLRLRTEVEDAFAEFRRIKQSKGAK